MSVRKKYGKVYQVKSNIKTKIPDKTLLKRKKPHINSQIGVFKEYLTAGLSG